MNLAAILGLATGVVQLAANLINRLWPAKPAAPDPSHFMVPGPPAAPGSTPTHVCFYCGNESCSPALLQRCPGK